MISVRCDVYCLRREAWQSQKKIPACPRAETNPLPTEAIRQCRDTYHLQYVYLPFLHFTPHHFFYCCFCIVTCEIAKIRTCSGFSHHYLLTGMVVKRTIQELLAQLSNNT
jgi:hypothetical protein